MENKKGTKTKKKKISFEYWFAYSDNNNKLQNALADCNYEITSRETILMAQEDIKRITGGNFRAFYNFRMLRKKYKTVEDLQETK